jgi:hypothetical protein
MAKIRLINTTKINGSFVEGGTILEIGIDLTKEEAKNLKNQSIAEDFLSIEEIEEVKIEQASLIETLTAEKADLEKQLEIEKAQNKTLTAEKADLEKKFKALEKPEK